MAATSSEGRRSWLTVFWIVLAVALCVKALAAPEKHTTFPCFVAGSQCWWADVDMYDVTVCRHEYRYSPTFAVLFSPFAWLPQRLGGALWNLLNVGVLYGLIEALRRDVFDLSWNDRQRTAYTLLAVLASIGGVWAGQTNTLVLGLVVAAAVAVLRERWWLAALCLALPVFIKVWPIAAVLLFVACWPRPLAGRLIVAGAVLAAVPFLTRPFGIVLGHYRHWLEGLAGPMQVRHVYRDAWTIWEVLHPPVNPAVYRGLQLASAGLVLVLCLWRHRTAFSRRKTLAFLLATWSAWQLLFGPGTERNTMCLIGPFLAWGLVRSLDERRGIPLMGAAFGLVTVFTFGTFERLLIGTVPLISGAVPCGVILFALWLAGDAFSTCRRDEPAPFAPS